MFLPLLMNFGMSSRNDELGKLCITAHTQGHRIPAAVVPLSFRGKTRPQIFSAIRNQRCIEKEAIESSICEDIEGQVHLGQHVEDSTFVHARQARDIYGRVLFSLCSLRLDPSPPRRMRETTCMHRDREGAEKLPQSRKKTMVLDERFFLVQLLVCTGNPQTF